MGGYHPLTGKDKQFMYIIGVIVTGFLLDLFLGDPHWMPHPVRLMGSMITGLTKSLRRETADSPSDQIRQGAVMAAVMAAVWFLAPLLILTAAGLMGGLAAVFGGGGHVLSDFGGKIPVYGEHEGL